MLQGFQSAISTLSVSIFLPFPSGDMRIQFSFSDGDEFAWCFSNWGDFLLPIVLQGFFFNVSKRLNWSELYNHFMPEFTIGVGYRVVYLFF